MIKNVSLKVFGTVQGVGFRYSTQKLALSLGILGYVKNNNDGTVSINAQGPDKKINLFIEKIKQGPALFGNVDKVEINFNENVKKYSNFSIIS